MDGARTLYGATKLAAELLIEEYRAGLGVPAVIDRCGVIAGPWQMGKVDQGVFTHWMLAHHFGKPLSYIGFGGKGKQVRDLLHVEDLVDLVERQLLDPRGMGRAHRQRRRRPRVQPLAAGDDRDLPRADRQRGSDRAGRGDPRRRRADIPFRLREALQPGRVATTARRGAGARRHPRVDRRGRSANRPGPQHRRPRGGKGVSTNAGCDHHGGGRPDRLRGGRALRRRGLRRRRHRERHAGPLLRPRGLDLPRDRAACLPRTPSSAGRERRHPRRATQSTGSSASRRAGSSWSSTPPPSPPTTGRRAIRRPTSASTPTAPSTCSRPPAPTAPRRPSSSARPTRSTAIPRTGCRWRSWSCGWSCPSPIPTTRGSTPRCRSTPPPTRCSASPRRPPTCWCRSTAATSRCRRSASAAAA